MIFTKSRSQRLRKAFNASMHTAKEKSQRSSRLRRVAIATGGFVGVAAASAGISSRRNREEARGDS
jgi:hypothetical protein